MSKIISNSIFMGRKSELGNISKYFSFNDFSTKKVYGLFGESGIGKSFICKHLHDNNSLLSDYTTILVDFNSQTSRSMINLIETISCFFVGERGAYAKTQELLTKYYNAIDSSKPVFYSELFDVFIEETNLFAQDMPMIVIMDTVEVVCNSYEWMQIRKFISDTSNRVCFLCSGIEIIDLAEISTESKLLGFSKTEISNYFCKRVPKLRKELRKESSFLLEKIQRFTNDGHPILCGLLADWLIESPSQINYILDNTRDISEKLIISEWIKEATNDDTSRLINPVLQLMSYFTKRMTPYILSQLLDIDENTSVSLIERIGKYSFVKYIQEDNNIILHDIIAKLIHHHHPIGDIAMYYNKTLLIYDDLIKESMTHISMMESAYLRLELTYYHMIFADIEEAIAHYEREFLSCLDTFDYSMCNILLAMICDRQMHLHEPKWYFTYQLAKADLLLADFQPQQSIEIYNELQQHECYSFIEFKVKADEIYARSVMNPCTAPKLNPLDAIAIFNKCIPIYSETSGAQYRLTRAWLNLAMAYVRVGNNYEAKNAFEEAEKYSTTELQKISILLEFSKMLRLQQNVDASLIPLMKCEALIGNIKANKGKYFYYYGNILRDLNEFDLAEEKYESALKELANGVDDFTLTEVYLDYSWMEYLRSEHVNFVRVYDFLEKGWELAKSKGFGVEYSEYYHIKYEIEKDEGDYETAFIHLETALNLAYEYSNIYMILDCLNHRAQQFFIQGDFESVPNVIREMAEIEKTGCGIRVFRGRAKLIQGDIYYQNGDVKKAFKEWKEGFCIVALYGNSRSNVELFSDLFLSSSLPGELSRKEKMRKIISQLGTPKRSSLQRYWTEKRVSEQFDYFLDELYA